MTSSAAEPEAISKTLESQPFTPPPVVEVKPALTVIPEPQPVEVKQPLFNIDLLTDRIDWTRVSACLSSSSSCICYGMSAQRLVIPKDTCELAVQNGWAKKS